MMNTLKIFATAIGFAIFGLATQSNAADTVINLASSTGLDKLHIAESGMSPGQFFILGVGLIAVRRIASRMSRVKT